MNTLLIDYYTVKWFIIPLLTQNNSVIETVSFFMNSKHVEASGERTLAVAVPPCQFQLDWINKVRARGSRASAFLQISTRGIWMKSNDNSRKHFVYHKIYFCWLYKEHKYEEVVQLFSKLSKYIFFIIFHQT